MFTLYSVVTDFYEALILWMFVFHGLFAVVLQTTDHRLQTNLNLQTRLGSIRSRFNKPKPMLDILDLDQAYVRNVKSTLSANLGILVIGYPTLETS